jgi:hypothetical protein
MKWIFDHVPLPVILFALVAVIQMVVKALKPGGRPAEETPGEGAQENNEERRVREIQERLRRIAAERRGQRAPRTEAPPSLHMPPELESPSVPAPAPQPFRRDYEEIERRLRPTPPVYVNTAEVERQQRLQEEMEALEARKFLAARQAQHLAEAEAAVAQSETGLRTTARARLLEDLREPHSVRRAIVLREVLGAPVGLR